MTMNLDYMLTIIAIKHTEDAIHGKDPMYDMAYDEAKAFYEELKNNPRTEEKELLKYLEHGFTSIEAVRGSNIDDKELVESCIRHYLYEVLKELVDMRTSQG